jgi:hypothetical protein
MWFDVDVSALQKKLNCRYWGLFGPHFPKFGLNFNPYSGYTVYFSLGAHSKMAVKEESLKLF